MVTIIFEAHSTTEDNEAELASGWNETPLSNLGKKQAAELGDRYAGKSFDAIFCSDLERTYKTAEIAFGTSFPIVKDRRLRECDYGDMTQKPKAQTSAYRETALTTPYPNGESYKDTSRRMKAFLEDLLKDYDGKTVMIIGHRATQYGLDELVKGMSLKEAVLAPWKWQPGWKYELSSLD